MAKTIETINDLQEYLAGVMSRADHHGHEVHEAALILAGLIVLYKDRESELVVRTYNDETANILWTQIQGKRYAFAYNHKAEAIEIRDRNEKGPALHRITNKLTCLELRTIMESLRSRKEST